MVNLKNIQQLPKIMDVNYNNIVGQANVTNIKAITKFVINS